MKETSREEIRALKLKSLELLKVFDKFCRRHKLRYFLCGGCCIGTIRHQGFIPWDDDVDVFMPRPDYERLRKLWKQEMDEHQYALCRSGPGVFLRSMLTAISDEETTFIKERQADLDIHHGVRLEILPLDGCPNNPVLRRLQILCALIFQVFNLQEAPTSKGKALEWAGKAMLALFPGQKARYRIWRLMEKLMSRYSFDRCTKTTELCSRYQYMVNEYPHWVFEKAVFKPFEGQKFPIPLGYDTYLTMAFGDYMELPPESAQIPKHDAVFVDLDHSYKNYRGVYFPVVYGSEEKKKKSVAKQKNEKKQEGKAE